VHACNNDGQSDGHQAPDRGVLDWGQVVAALEGIGYRHPQILEILGGDDPDGLLQRLEGLWQHL